MDTMKLLLGATIALLLGALGVSWQGMVKDSRNSPSDEIAKLQKQVKELQGEQDKLALDREIHRLHTPTVPTSTDLESIKLEQQRLALEQLKAEQEKAERDKNVLNQEDAEMAKRDIEDRDKELRRARLISQALLMGKVSEYVPNAEGGGFVTFEILAPEQVQIGTILGIRRKTGILGTLKVVDITTEGAVADPSPGFGTIPPIQGDELILPPQY